MEMPPRRSADVSPSDRQPAEGGRREVDEALRTQQRRRAERRDPYQAEPDDHQCTDELTDEDGNPYVICQEPVGEDRVIGGGEFPDPNTPARSPAPGAADTAPSGD
jgi:hypothetical protein